MDLFEKSFQEHFGSIETGQVKLRANLREDGVEQRVTIQSGDMRRLPFEPAIFDAAVITYAMDHLNRTGSIAALAETFRVLKPGGDFLLMVISKDGWPKFTFGRSCFTAEPRARRSGTSACARLDLR